MKRSGDELTAAIQVTDLTKLILEFFPDSKVEPGVPGVYFAAWRGNTNTPALSISKKGQVWLWHDMATGEGGNAFDFLAGPIGMGRQEAAITLLERAGMPTAPSDAESQKGRPKPLPADVVRPFERPEPVAIEAMKGRGFNRKMLKQYRIVPAEDNPDDALIPITNPEGVIVQVKRRVAKPGKYKYKYEHKGYGGHAWCSDNSRKSPVLYVIEGELNAMVAHAALQEAGEVNVGVIGVPGAEHPIYDGICLHKSVFIYSDDDEAGRKAMTVWPEQARDQGARSVHRMPPMHEDFCDFAGRHGRPALAQKLREMHHFSTQVYGVLDRVVGEYTVRELAESAKRYLSGSVINPTGFKEIDAETGGLGESGVITICALPSMGKSALLRRFCLEHVRSGGTVRLYSPDQSTHAIYRLLANTLSDVSAREARRGYFNRRTLERYGSPEDAMKAWREAYEHVLLELSRRFQVSEESALREISKDMERGVDQGVTMFAGDYVQLFEPDFADRGPSEGLAINEFKKLSRSLNVLFIGAVQLAKYKFPETRKSGIPFPRDIEGSGKIFQASEQSYFVYNDDIYSQKYAGPDTQLLGDGPDIARLFLRKDKEGAGDDQYQLLWLPHLVTFRDPKRPKLEDEREGLM